jgi:hypothetical protein
VTTTPAFIGGIFSYTEEWIEPSIARSRMIKKIKLSLPNNSHQTLHQISLPFWADISIIEIALRSNGFSSLYK